jgi:alpha-tubulin suppressor-like RCC1 family protein
LQNGKVYLWGSPEWGGAYTPVESVSNISKIIATERGFAALLADNNVMSWGPDAITIEKPADATSGQTPKATRALQNLKDIQPGYNSFFATRQDGSFVAWGNLYSVSQDDYFPAEPCPALA